MRGKEDTFLPYQGIADLHAGETTEIPVSRPEFTYTVLLAQGSNPRIMYMGTRCASVLDRGPQNRPVVFRFRKKYESGGFKPRLNLANSFIQRCRRTIDPGMGHYGQEFVNARPRYCPVGTSLCQFNNAGISGIVPLRVFPVSVNENIAVYSDQPPRPS
jgi:hypothetical protein